MQITSFLRTLTLLRGYDFQVLRKVCNQFFLRIWGDYVGKLKPVCVIETYDNVAWESVDCLVQPLTQNRTNFTLQQVAQDLSQSSFQYLYGRRSLRAFGP